MLTDQQLERYSRQILLPEVGGRGQLRLQAATVALAGTGPAHALVETLLERAGVGRLVASDHPGVDTADAVVDLTGDGAWAARIHRPGRPAIVVCSTPTTALVATLVGHPCPACLPADAAPPPAAGPVRTVTPALPALVGGISAGEVLRVLLVAPDGGRVHRITLGAGTCTADVLTGGGCARCGGAV